MTRHTKGMHNEPERPPLVKGDKGALVFAGTLLVVFWLGVALLLRGCQA